MSPSSKAATVYGRQGNRWLETPSKNVRTGDLYGSTTQCATCRKDRACTTVASDPGRPENGRWFVCDSCRASGERLRCGLKYEPATRGGEAA